MRKSDWNGWQHLGRKLIQSSLLVRSVTRVKSVSLAAGAVLLFSATTLVAPMAHALGLGEIDTRSALNERFAAQIELLDTRDLAPAEVIASLASSEDFSRVGVERFFFLTNLKFNVVRNSRGNLVVQATSVQPITEPYLNFLVEVLWPSGRLLKEYTVLLDPPTFTHSAAAPVVAPGRESSDVSSAGRIQRSESQPSQSARVAPFRDPAPRVSNNDGTYGATNRNDTLWAITNQTLPSNSVTPQQHMLAIQRLNPNAFIDGNVNLLKAGVVLRLPTEGDAQAIDPSAAVSEVNEQNRAWRAGTPARSVAASEAASSSAAPIDATTRGPGQANAAPRTADGRLSIVAADAAGVVDGLANTGASETQTAQVGDRAAQERIETLAREVDELTYQLDLQKRGVDEQISTREKQITLKDQQISQLQQQLAEAQAAAQTQPQSQPQQGAANQSNSQQTAVEETPFWQKPAVLGGVLGGFALLLAGVMFKRRQAKADEDLALDDFETGEPSYELGAAESESTVTPLADADLVGGDLDHADAALAQADGMAAEADLAEELSEANLDGDELSDDDLFGPADDAKEPLPGITGKGSEDGAQTSDVIGEADIYIAYGRYPQAIALLQGAVDSNPTDHAVRLRLLEVCAETKDAEGYAQQAGQLRHFCDDATTLASADALHESLDDDLRTQVDALGDQGSDSDSLLSGVSGAAVGAGAAVAAGAASLFGSDDAEASDSSIDADSLLTGELDSVESAADEFQLDLDDDTEFDIPSVDTGEFETNVDMNIADLDDAADLDLSDALSDTPAAVEDFELDLDLESDTTNAFTAEFDVENSEVGAESLTGSLDIDLPDETSELARVVGEADDDELLDEIERSLDELEADGLLTPELNEDAEFSFDDDADTSATKLDLARAYIDMGDDDGAREILDEVITEGDSNQQGEASELLGKL